MTSRIRKNPIVCLMISLFNLIRRRLKFQQDYVSKLIHLKQGNEYEIFRHITLQKQKNSSESILIVSFKFAHLSHKANKIISIIPMLMIAGFPGFITKIYSVNKSNGYWQGIYQWDSNHSLSEYKNSLVFNIMKKRAVPESIKLTELNNYKLNESHNKNYLTLEKTIGRK